MKRLGLLGSFVVFFAACGGGGGSDSGTKCGNGQVEGSEQCDDGNTSSGDGCDSTCRTERSGVCGDGTFDVQFEQCDDGNTVSGDGCDADCNLEGPPAVCGDGVVTGNEQCDDHNTDSGDGCSSTCQTEHVADASCTDPQMIQLMDDGFGGNYGEITGNTSTGMNGFAAAICDGTPDVGGGKDKTFKLVLSSASDVEIYSMLDSENFANAVRLTTTACDGSTEVVQSYDTLTGCQASDFPDLDFVALPAGTYYITVDGASATDEGEFDFEVDTYESFCGDGFVDFNEECDDNNTTDTDGCTARCMIAPGYRCDNGADDEGPSVCVPDTCGNGVIDTGEECDDHNTVTTDGCTSSCKIDPRYNCTGTPSTCTAKPAVCGDNILEVGEECEDHNTANSDGCSSICKLEFDVSEVETNNTTPQVLTAGSHRIKASLSATTDVDLFRFTTTASMKLELETYTTIDSSYAYDGEGDDRYDCTGATPLDTYAYIFDSTGTPTGTSGSILQDDDDGSHNIGRDYGCSYIGANNYDADATLPAGTYTLRINNATGGMPNTYYIALMLTP